MIPCKTYNTIPVSAQYNLWAVTFPANQSNKSFVINARKRL
jgi:hypothetical protein